MNYQNDNSTNGTISEIADTLICISEQIGLQPKATRDSRLASVLNQLGERLEKIKSQ
jgi:hypothetical protein